MGAGTLVVGTLVVGTLGVYLFEDQAKVWVDCTTHTMVQWYLSMCLPITGLGLGSYLYLPDQY